MLQHWRVCRLYKPPPFIRRLIWCLPRLLTILDVAIRVNAVWGLRWWSEIVILLCLGLSVLLAEQSEGPIRNVEAAEDEDGEEDLLSHVKVSKAAQL